MLNKDLFFEGQEYGEVLAYGKALQILGKLPETPEIYQAKEQIREELHKV